MDSISLLIKKKFTSAIFERASLFKGVKNVKNLFPIRLKMEIRIIK